MNETHTGRSDPRHAASRTVRQYAARKKLSTSSFQHTRDKKKKRKKTQPENGGSPPPVSTKHSSLTHDGASSFTGSTAGEQQLHLPPTTRLSAGELSSSLGTNILSTSEVSDVRHASSVRGPLHPTFSLNLHSAVTYMYSVTGALLTVWAGAGMEVSLP